MAGRIPPTTWYRKQTNQIARRQMNWNWPIQPFFKSFAHCTVHTPKQYAEPRGRSFAAGRIWISQFSDLPQFACNDNISGHFAWNGICLCTTLNDINLLRVNCFVVFTMHVAQFVHFGATRCSGEMLALTHQRHAVNSVGNLWFIRPLAWLGTRLEFAITIFVFCFFSFPFFFYWRNSRDQNDIGHSRVVANNISMNSMSFSFFFSFFLFVLSFVLNFIENKSNNSGRQKYDTHFSYFVVVRNEYRCSPLGGQRKIIMTIFWRMKIAKENNKTLAHGRTLERFSSISWVFS